MKSSEISSPSTPPSAVVKNSNEGTVTKTQKPHFRPAQDDTKPVLQDPILRSDPIETEEAVLRLPPFPAVKARSSS